MSVAVSDDGSYMASGNDDPSDSNGSQLDLFDGPSGTVYWTHVPGSNGGNDLRSLDIQPPAGSDPYFASGGSGQCTVFLHDVSSSTPQWSGTSVGERDRVSLLSPSWIATCDIHHPRVVIYETGYGSTALHQVTTEGDCLTVDTAARTPVRPGYQYCPGDGSGTQCPVMNNNSGRMAGCLWDPTYVFDGGVLDATGTEYLSDIDVYFQATDVENNFGIFFGAANSVNGGNGMPFGCGLRCAGGALVRLTSPALAINHRASCGPVEALDTGAAPGLTRYYQYWFRSPSCSQQFNLTNGYAITWWL